MARPNEFSRPTQERALSRQLNLCASCGARIFALGLAGQAKHRYGEGAEAHHRRPIRPPFYGSASVDNCVIICRSCHYNVHEGGNYTFSTVVGRKSDYPHFQGKCLDRACLCWS